LNREAGRRRGSVCPGYEGPFVDERDEVRAVFFDAGYTLLCMDPPQETIFLNVCRDLGLTIDRSRLASAVHHPNAMFGPRPAASTPVAYSQERIDRFWIEYHRRVIEGCAIDAGAAVAAGAVYRRFCEALGWRVYDEVRAMLADLRARGLVTGVISNWTGDLEDVLRRVDLHEHFDIVIDSARFGHEKPHPEIFREALARSGVAAAQAMHVGDSIEHDVDGALGSGLRAVLLDRHGRHASFARAPRVSTLDQIAAFLS